MFVILLRFAAGRAEAARHMQAHEAWLKRGFDDGVFLLSGSLRPEGGGGILAQGEPRAALEARIAADPFVAGGVVTAEIHEIAPGRTDARLAFLGTGG